jgi:hypothetical protein
VKYLALIYGEEGAWDALSDADKQSVYGQYRTFIQAAGDKLVDGAETAASTAATTVRVRDGQTEVNDGPYTETKEQLGGFFVFDCDSFDEAVALAKQIPGLDRGAVEIRPAYVEATA